MVKLKDINLKARGFKQMYGLDYEETFAFGSQPQHSSKSFTIYSGEPRLAIIAFLNIYLEEEVCMQIHPGFDNNLSEWVCRRKKALYGLKQSPQTWFERFSKAMKMRNYHKAHSDHTTFYKHTPGHKINILIVYVDNILITEEWKWGVCRSEGILRSTIWN